MNETLSAIVVTEDGQTLECNLEIRGEVTHYPLNKNTFGMEDQVTIYANGARMVMMNYLKADEVLYLFGLRNTMVCIMGVSRDVVILETDVQSILPEMNPQRCLLVTGGADWNTVWEEGRHFDIPLEFVEQLTFLSCLCFPNFRKSLKNSPF